MLTSMVSKLKRGYLLEFLASSLHSILYWNEVIDFLRKGNLNMKNVGIRDDKTLYTGINLSAFAGTYFLHYQGRKVKPSKAVR